MSEKAEFRTVFKYDVVQSCSTPSTRAGGKGHHHPDRKMVTCKMLRWGRLTRSDEYGWIEFSSGSSICSEQDKYVKEIGRRIAIRRAHANAWWNGHCARVDDESWRNHRAASSGLISGYFNR